MTSPTDVMDGRLGRRYAPPHPRNREFRIRPLLDARAAVERKPTFWPLPAGPWPLNQAAEGACEAFGLAHELAAGPVQVAGMTNDWAFAYYRRIQVTDQAMGNFFESGTTTLANMITAKAEGHITGYRWADGVDDVVDTVCSIGPVCLGVDWTSGMYRTARGGRITVTGSLVGGHFIVVVGYDVHPEWGPCVLILNSWGNSYGVSDARLGVPGGIGWLTLPDLDLLLRGTPQGWPGEAVVPADFFVAPAPVRPVYVARRRSKVFHKSTCRNAPRIEGRGFTTRDDALAAGLRPCRWCKP